MGLLRWALSGLTGGLLRGKWIHRDTRESPCKHTGRRWLSATGERPQEKSDLLTPWSWTFWPPDCKNINFCCLSPWVCGILLCQPSQTNTYGNLGNHVPSSRRFCHVLGWTLEYSDLVGKWRMAHNGGLRVEALCVPGLEVVHTRIHILLAKSQSQGHIQLQVRLGKVLR